MGNGRRGVGGKGRADPGYGCVEVKNGEWETRGGGGKGRADPGYGCVEVKNGEWETRRGGEGQCRSRVWMW